MPANVVVAEQTNAIASAGSCVRLSLSHARNFRRRSRGVDFVTAGEDVAASGVDSESAERGSIAKLICRFTASISRRAARPR